MMKKAVILLMSFLVSTSFSQDLAKKVYIEPTFGLPSAGRTMINLSHLSKLGDEDYKVTGNLIQLGLKSEYVISNYIGVGLDVNYEKSGYATQSYYSSYDPATDSYIDSDTTYSWSQTKIRTMARFYYHFGRGEKVDTYTGAGFGYTHRTQKNPENALSIDDYKAFIPLEYLSREAGPFAARIFIGWRFMFHQNIGMGLEVGLGSGSLLNLSISTRF